MKGFKFLALEQYLRNYKEEHIELTFKEIESILSAKLSASAYKHIAYWHLSETHTFPYAWINAGYKMDKLDLKGKKVSFVKEYRQLYIDNNISKSNVPKLFSYKVKPLIEIDFLINKASEFLQCLNEDENSRYLSWEHCYKEFSACKELNEQNLDRLSLHLAFYLASWGMYRGSSFLLQKDYRVHKDAIKQLYNPRYKQLWGIRCENLMMDDSLNLVFELSEKLRDIYVEKRWNLDDLEDISQILITKILMGTMGCVPAFDRFFLSTVKTYKIAVGNFNKKSLYDLAMFYNYNKTKFEIFRQKILSSRKVDYPEMKVLDMSFWYISYKQD